MDACCPTTPGGHRRAQDTTCPLPDSCPSAACAAAFVTYYDDCSLELQGTRARGGAAAASVRRLLRGLPGAGLWRSRLAAAAPSAPSPPPPFWFLDNIRSRRAHFGAFLPAQQENELPPRRNWRHAATLSRDVARGGARWHAAFNLCSPAPTVTFTTTRTNRTTHTRQKAQHTHYQC
eukprot:COSAG06_NODE_1633_length_8855_cov_18.666971_3_plen_177_part_00